MISLGSNCYTRTILTKYGLKRRKANGELSYPFDLCYSSLADILYYLKNDFKSFFKGIEYITEGNYSYNKNNNMIYPHDNFNENIYKNFAVRYSKRIKNFFKLYKSDKNICFISTLFDDQFDYELVNQIYTVLYEKMKSKNFKYIIIHLKSNPLNSEIDVRFLNPAIVYKTINVNVNNYRQDWIHGDIRKLEKTKIIEKEFIDTIYEFNKDIYGTNF